MQENIDLLQTTQSPLPLQVMVDSVVTPDNFTYEREEIERSIKNKGISSQNRERLTKKLIFSQLAPQPSQHQKYQK